ncbi:MAG: DNA mismatch repair protein MutS, partial [Oscillospiraceae bacterium]
ANLLKGKQSALLRKIAETDPVLEVSALISRAICDEPPFSVREGGILRSGYSEEVDRLRDVRDNGSRLVSELEQRERENTGIKKLKVGYNRVFGYYIDIPRASSEDVPETYIRKQTLVSNERFFTEELKELENTLVTSRDRIAELEFKFFDDVRVRTAAEVTRIQAVADAIAELDAICSLAEVAVRNGYTMPELDLSQTLSITAGRHPVVEKMQSEALFVPNDTFLNNSDDRVAIITGPNMAGKSTYMRQTALIVLMAQMGSFVPAKSATIGVVDRIFTRIGASDDLSSGRSTFMVEMTEVADILRFATSASLLILDEIGRGTSTYDGMAIARAVLEYCADKRKLGAKTLFATHYHELSCLEGQLAGVRNYNITAKKQGGDLIFLRKIVRGAADDSYGIEVAKLAGVPDFVILRAKCCLKDLESGNTKAPAKKVVKEESQISFSDVGTSEIAQVLRETSIDTLTPIEALNLLFELKKKVDA